MSNKKNKEIYFAPSVMLIDIFKAKDQLDFLNLHSDIFHIDIKDGNYVKSFGTTPLFIKQIKPIVTKPIDAHLMINEPWEYLEEIAESGADYITPHTDVIEKEAFCIIRKIKSLGCKAGIAINPSIPLQNIQHYIHLLDKITIMTVDPGYSGQPFILQTLDKVKSLVKIRKEKQLNFLIETDGSIDKEYYEQIYESGADVIVLGGPALFDKSADIDIAWDIMKNEFETALSPVDK